MPQLVAKGLTLGDQFERELTIGDVCRVGRKPASGLAVGWDKQISREHFDVQCAGVVRMVSF